MSKNVDTLRAAHENWNRRDFEAVLRVVNDKLNYIDKPRNLTYRNKNEFRTMLEDWANCFSDGKITNATYTDAGNSVVAQYTLTGTNTGPFGRIPPTNRKVNIEMCQICHFDANNKLTSAETYYDLYTLLVQLGQAPPMAAAA